MVILKVAKATLLVEDDRVHVGAGLCVLVLHHAEQLVLAVLLDHCPGPKPPFLAVKRPARPYKSTI